MRQQCRYMRNVIPAARGIGTSIRAASYREGRESQIDNAIAPIEGAVVVKPFGDQVFVDLASQPRHCRTAVGGGPYKTGTAAAGLRRGGRT